MEYMLEYSVWESTEEPCCTRLSFTKRCVIGPSRSTLLKIIGNLKQIYRPEFLTFKVFGTEDRGWPDDGKWQELNTGWEES